ncbi:MAG: hypothetical protein GDA44_01345 [Prochloron sp. SP5CPC1]|nr:hypothetical protein [Candidatus Paraprochloron terpiosi SP5CPC1]
MAKRRNLKKEKAARNKAYARQFRKKFSRYSSRNKRFGRSNYNRDGEQLASETKSETETSS